MNIVQIFCAFLYFFGLSRNFVISTKWVDELTRYIVDDLQALHVQLITKNMKNEITRSRIVEEIITKLVQNLPVQRINVAKSYDEMNNSKPADDDNEDSGLLLVDTSATFFIIIRESRKGLPKPTSKGAIDKLAVMSFSNYRPKYLMISSSSVPNNSSLEELLIYAWSKKLLDLTIIEFTENQIIKNFTKINNHPHASTIIHHLNPFNNVYTRTNWTSSIELFPNKVNNLWGHVLKARTINAPPFSIAEFNENGDPINIGGVENFIMQTIAETLNFSLKYIEPINSSQYYENNTLESINSVHTITESEKIDLTSYLSPHVTNFGNKTYHTMPVLDVEFCPVVPIMSKNELTISTNFFQTYTIIFCLLAIFWILRRVLRLKPPVWQAFNIVRLLFGVSVTIKPKKNIDRIIFSCFLVTSAIYSSSIYSDITQISLRTSDVMKFESIEDLNNSGLIPIIQPFHFNKTFENFDGVMMSLRKKSIQVDDIITICAEIAPRYKNITCFMENLTTELVISRSKIKGRETLEKMKACFWSGTPAFILDERSPYRLGIDNVIMRMHCTGVIQKLFNDNRLSFRKFNDEQDDVSEEHEWKENMIALRRQLLTLTITGYVIGLLVFFAEIAVYIVYGNTENWITKIFSI